MVNKDINIFRFFKITAAVILDWIFKMAAAAILDCRIHKILLAVGVWLSVSYASLYQISSKSVVPLQRYCDFSNFQIGQRRHLGFLKSWNFIRYCGREGLGASACKFHQNQSIGCEDIKIFPFWRWRPSAILDLFRAYLDYEQWVFGGLYHSAKFGYDRCSRFYNMSISIFGPFGWKMPIHAAKIGVLGQFDPLNGLQYQPKPNRHILACVRVILAIKRVNLASGLTCRCVS